MSCVFERLFIEKWSFLTLENGERQSYGSEKGFPLKIPVKKRPFIGVFMDKTSSMERSTRTPLAKEQCDMLTCESMCYHFIYFV